jgi:DNA-binding NarL/FixJ family response regulator
MPRSGAEVAAPAIPIEASCGPIALLAAEEDEERLLAALIPIGCTIQPCAQLARVLDAAATAPAALVLALDDDFSQVLGHVEELRRRFPQSPIVLVAWEIERWEVRSALAAGVAGLVLFDQLEQALEVCVRAALAGQSCVPLQHSQQIVPPVLSTREKQILGLVVMGYMNAQIAEQLVLAESTVKSHLSSAFGKLGVRSRNEAVNLILDPDRGLGIGILALSGEPSTSSEDRSELG